VDIAIWLPGFRLSFFYLSSGQFYAFIHLKIECPLTNLVLVKVDSTQYAAPDNDSIPTF